MDGSDEQEEFMHPIARAFGLGPEVKKPEPPEIHIEAPAKTSNAHRDHAEERAQNIRQKARKRQRQNVRAGRKQGR